MEHEDDRGTDEDGQYKKRWSSAEEAGFEMKEYHTIMAN